MADDNQGTATVPIELDGKEMEMTPSLGACLAISNIAGGLNAAVQRCLSLDANTICAVLTAGLGLNPRQAATLPQAAYNTGLIALSAPCIDFINIIANGGRPLLDEEDQDELDPPKPASP